MEDSSTKEAVLDQETSEEYIRVMAGFMIDTSQKTSFRHIAISGQINVEQLIDELIWYKIGHWYTIEEKLGYISFNNKIELFKDLYDPKDELKENLTHLTKIRNVAAHDASIAKVYENEDIHNSDIVSRIDQMNTLGPLGASRFPEILYDSGNFYHSFQLKLIFTMTDLLFSYSQIEDEDAFVEKFDEATREAKYPEEG